MDAAPDRAARPAAGHVARGPCARVPRAGVPDGQLHLRRRRQRALGPREHRRAHAPLDRARVRLGADHLLPQMARCARPGTCARPRVRRDPDDVVSLGRRATGRAGRSWPARPTAAFLPAARSARSRGWTPGARRHALVEVPGYTHLDLFFGANAERDVFGTSVERSAAELPTPGGVRVGGEGLLWKPQHSTRRLVSVASRPTVRCCGCAATTSWWRSSGWATTTPSGPIHDRYRQRLSPTRARCWRLALGRRGRPAGRLPARLRALCATTTARDAARLAVPRRAQPLHRPPAPARCRRRPRSTSCRARRARPAGRDRAPRGPAPLGAGRPAPARAAALALLMRELDGLTYAELADALDTSVPGDQVAARARAIGLVEAGEARDTACADIRATSSARHGRGVRTSGRSRRHLRDCNGLPRVPPGAARSRRGPGGARARRRRAARRRGQAAGDRRRLVGRRGGRGRGGRGRRHRRRGGRATAATATATKVVAIVCCAAVVGGGAAEVRQQVSPRWRRPVTRRAMLATPRHAPPRSRPRPVQGAGGARDGPGARRRARSAQRAQARPARHGRDDARRRRDGSGAGSVAAPRPAGVRDRGAREA
jgi:hypothetical protein